MKKKLTKALALMLSVITLGTLTGCESKSEERTLRISRPNSYTATTACIMQEKELLEKYLPEGVTVEWSIIASGPDMRDAIVSKQVDMTSGMAQMTFIAAYESGLPLTLLSYDALSPLNMYSNDPEITAMDEFTETSRIAIGNKGTSHHLAFLAYCKQELGDAMIYDNLLSTIPAADAIASLQSSKDYNAAIFSFPNLSKAAAIEGVTLLADMTEIVEEYGMGGGFFMNSDYYSENPDIVEAFYKAQDEALQFIQDNTKEAAQILSEIFGVDEDEVLEVLQLMPPKKEVVGYDKQAQLMYEVGILEKEPTKFADMPNYEKIPK